VSAATSCECRTGGGVTDALAYVYFEEESGRRSTAHMLTRDEARASPLSLRLPDSSAGVVAGKISVLGLAGSRINAEQA